VPREAVLSRALDVADQIARCGPVAVRAAKRAIDGGLDAPTLRKGLDVEWACYQEIVPTEDRLEALEAFAQKRKPVYRGR
jgi:enoyl-CoA hydratase/carnithine racemase